MAHSIGLKFHGVRAIHPVPARENQSIGGNTSCIELVDSETRIFVNAGFGISQVGTHILAERNRGIFGLETNILFTDFLWDSIMGLTSFAPLHHTDAKINIFTGGPTHFAQAALDEVTSNLFSPFDGLSNMAAKTSFTEVQTAIQIGAWIISSIVLDNDLTDGGSSVWRLKHLRSGDDIGIALLCNTETKTLKKLTSFFRGCQTIVCGATNPANNGMIDKNRMGFQDALNLALATSSQSLVLTHFHPSQSDIELQGEFLDLQTRLNIINQRNNNFPLDIRLATELSERPLMSSQALKLVV